MVRTAPDGRPAVRPGSGLAGYVAAWLAAGAAIAAIAVGLTGPGQAPAPAPAGAAALPPVREAGLGAAMRHAGCRIRAAAASAPSVVVLAPRAGVSRTPLDAGRRAAGVRRGLIVVEYRRDVRDGAYAQLRRLQEVVPNGTVLAPNPRLAHDQVTVTAYRRQLRCPALARGGTLDALRLFRGRYLGSMPARRAG
jgi:hypothetical protein